MKILVACEFTGVVRNAFAVKGHDAWSCDLIPSEMPGQHIQDDVLNHLDEGWDMMIAHPPCTYLCVSGARYWKDRQVEQRSALKFVRQLLGAPIPKIALENPKGCISTRIRKPTQLVHPYYFGSFDVKETHLWLTGLPWLRATNVSKIQIQSVLSHGPSSERGQDRSRTDPYFARAMADQWG